jgi:arsenate reductase (glutaredoxin)
MTTIYHNPDCGTSRNTLALIRASGIDPVIVDYLRNPPDRITLQTLIARSGMAVRDLLRKKGTPYASLGLDDPGLSDQQLLDHALSHPILINRPIVVSTLGVKLCRPSDVVLDLLPGRVTTDLKKEDGSPVLADSPIGADDPAFRAALSAADLPINDLQEPGRQFYSYRTLGGQRVGYGGMERHGGEVLLRSITVLPNMRGQGIGKGVLALLLRRAFDQGARRAWLLTVDAAEFFEAAGFSSASRQEAPKSILDTTQAKSLCPSTAFMLTRNIEL